MCRARIYADLTSRDGSARAVSESISHQNQTVRIVERKRPNQDAFNEREDCGRSTDAQGHCEDDGKGKARRLTQLAKCHLEILCGREHSSSAEV